MTMSIIPYFVIIYLWIKTPSFNDTFWIREATKLVFIALAFLFITNIIFGILALYLQYHFVILSLIDSHIISLTNFIIIIIMTFGVFYNNKSSFTPQLHLQAFISAQPSKKQVNKTENSKTSSNGGSVAPVPKLNLPSTTSNSSNGSNQASPNKRIDLKTVLKDSMAFHIFMSHLATEFSSFVIAIVQ